MKKSAITVLICITLAFAAFVGGFYVGRRYGGSAVTISGIPTAPPPTAQTTAPNTTMPSQSQATTPTGPVTININEATKEELELLPGIGPKLAQAIIDYRNEYGQFQSPEELLHVPGIGSKKLEAILEFITTGG